MENHLAILGASVRAACGSARRAGYAVCAIDLFADTDTGELADARRIADYPHDFLAAAEQLPVMPWMYTGGLENYPSVVEQLAARRPLWGNASPVLCEVRDPFVWTTALDQHGFYTANVSREGASVPRDGSWLQKSLRSAGGLGIRVVDAATELSDVASGDQFFQQRRCGVNLSAVFVGTQRRAKLLGATRQLCGAPWNDDSAFVYAGSIGPYPLAPAFAAELQRLGDALADLFGLTGLFGVDGIVNGDGFCPVEINPRYVASIEILERASGENFVAFHADACRLGRLPTHDVAAAYSQRVLGKAIVYAPCNTTFHRAASDWLADLRNDGPWAADIPAIGEPLPANGPVLTVFATGESHDAVESQLLERSASLRRVLAT